MIPQTRKYYVITVHFGDEAPTRTLIAHLQSGSKIPDQIIVVDHAQKPLKLEPLANLTVIRPEKNAGYGAGINLGLGLLVGQKANSTDIVVALNNDVQIVPKSLAQVSSWLDSHPTPALTGIQWGYVDLLTGRSHIAPLPAQKSRYLPYLDGACIIAPLSVLVSLQGFPPQGFMYWEDVTLARRAQEVGLPTIIVPNTGVTHSVRPELAQTDDQLYYLVRNGAIFLSTYSPRPWRYFWKIKNLLRLFYHNLRPTQKKSIVIRQALKDAWQNQTGKRA